MRATLTRRIARALCLLPTLAALSGLGCERAEERAPAATALAVVKSKTGAEMALIPAGWFEMGSRQGKPDESPAHRVWVDAFLVDRCEVTQEQYGKVVLGNPSRFKGPRMPMEQVSWGKAALYCNARSRAEGLQPCYDDSGQCNFRASGYRLPTEAEWEYACRAGTDADYFFGRGPQKLKDYAWYKDNASAATHPVGQKRPNPWGLYDLCGNVAEWCNDIYDEGFYKASPDRSARGPAEGDRYVVRGGAWSSSADTCRSSYRVGEPPGSQGSCFSQDAIGFRCARNAPQGDPGADPPNGDPPPKTGLVYDDIYLRHKTTPSHPESPQRLEAIMTRLRESGLLSQLTLLKPSPAPLEWITTVHSPEHAERIRKSCEEGTRYVGTMDTPVSRDSYEVALAAAGGVLRAVDAVMAGEVRNAFCAIRPPGHHASKDRAMGFCLFNNVAIAARYIQKKHKLPKVLIVDWDVHHGNGTQSTFYDDPTVLHFDVHQSPFYPGTGSQDETGAGQARNTKINVPLPAGSGDQEYKAAFETKLRPAALAFRPDFVLVSAGFDAYKDDTLGSMKLTEEGYGALTKIVKGIAEECCKGRLVSVLEGGYNLDGLARSVEAHLRVLME